MGSNSSSLSIDIKNTALNERMTEIMTSNANSASNIVQLSNTVRIENHGTLECGETLTIDQSNEAKSRIVAQITNEVSEQLRTMINNDIQSSASQTDTLIQGFLAGIGQVNNQNLRTAIKNQLVNIINTRVTTQNINSVLNHLQVVNSAEIINYGTLTSRECTILQNNAVDFASDTIINNLSASIVNDAVINRSVAEATQVQTTEQRGVDDLLRAAIIPLILIAIILALGAGKILNPLFVLVLGGLVLGYLVIAYFTKIPPFKPLPQTEFWICGKDSNGYNTGVCVSVPQNEVPQGEESFATQALCEAAVSEGKRCQQYWRCEVGNDGFYTGNALQCQSLSDGTFTCPYKNQAEALTTCANFVYRCDRGTTGGLPTATCNRVNPDAVNEDDETYSGITPVLALANCTTNCVIPETTTSPLNFPRVTQISLPSTKENYSRRVIRRNINPPQFNTSRILRSTPRSSCQMVR